jgi:hypothetical protein
MTLSIRARWPYTRRDRGGSPGGRSGVEPGFDVVEGVCDVDRFVVGEVQELPFVGERVAADEAVAPGGGLGGERYRLDPVEGRGRWELGVQVRAIVIAAMGVGCRRGRR